MQSNLNTPSVAPHAHASAPLAPHLNKKKSCKNNPVKRLHGLWLRAANRSSCLAKSSDLQGLLVRMWSMYSMCMLVLDEPNCPKSIKALVKVKNWPLYDLFYFTLFYRVDRWELSVIHIPETIINAT